MRTRDAFTLVTFISVLSILFPLLTAGSPSGELLGLVVEAYIQAAADRDVGRLVQASSEAWRPHALRELGGFAGLPARVEGLACSVLDLAGGTATVTCRGAILASDKTGEWTYSLAGRVFQLEQENGVWRVSGASAGRPGVWELDRANRPLLRGG